MNKRYFITNSLTFLLVLLINASSGIARDYIAPKATTAPVIDGIADEDIWQGQTEWYAIDQTWDKAVPSAADFTGKFKLAWGQNKLYLLAEITDDSLNDNSSNPLTNYWEDDALEVFVDEDKSGGEHEKNYNAFAYHISTLLDVVDMDKDGSAKLYNNHITAKWTKRGHVYTWECAITVYTDEFVYGDDAAHIGNLETGKKIGFALAYCDNDGPVARQSFIGSEVVEGTNKNVAYINASVFGTATLTDGLTGIEGNNEDNSLSALWNSGDQRIEWSLTNLIGQTVYRKTGKPENDAFKGLPEGVYILQATKQSNALYNGKYLIK